MPDLPRYITFGVVINLLVVFMTYFMAGAEPFQVTYLTAAVSNTDTTLNVTDTSGFLGSGYLTVDNEIMFFNGKTATTFTVTTRGYGDTEPSGHASGAGVNDDEAGGLNTLIGYDIVGNVSNGSILDKFEAPITVPLALTFALIKIIVLNAWWLNSGVGLYVKYFLWAFDGIAIVFILIFGIFRRG